MKLIDEKIKALGLTKGQYCEKYGFKFKDFAAKVHTLEAKIEWANTFLKPLGLKAPIVPEGRSAARFLIREQLEEQADEQLLKAADPQGQLYYDETLEAICMYTGSEIALCEAQDDADSLL